jgi:aminoglycoside 6'-N-acetyltransferase
VAVEADVDLLVGWHADPEIARFWDDKQFSRSEMLARIARPRVDAYIVEADETPVGYLQAWFDSDEPDRSGLDMFLIPTSRGQGLGPDAARTLAKHLLAGGQSRVTVDPYSSNSPAIRAWTRAGFRPVTETEHEPDSEHGEPWILMVFDPSHLM